MHNLWATQDLKQTAYELKTNAQAVCICSNHPPTHAASRAAKERGIKAQARQAPQNRTCVRRR